MPPYHTSLFPSFNFNKVQVFQLQVRKQKNKIHLHGIFGVLLFLGQSFLKECRQTPLFQKLESDQLCACLSCELLWQGIKGLHWQSTHTKFLCMYHQHKADEQGLKTCSYIEISSHAVISKIKELVWVNHRSQNYQK